MPRILAQHRRRAPNKNVNYSEDPLMNSYGKQCP